MRRHTDLVEDPRWPGDHGHAIHQLLELGDAACTVPSMTLLAFAARELADRLPPREALLAREVAALADEGSDMLARSIWEHVRDACDWSAQRH
jgi:hypothetical protein